MDKDQIKGRLLTDKELNEEIEGLAWMPAIVQEGEKKICQRCFNQQDFYPNECLCAKECYYCLSCLKMGKIRTCDRLYYREEDTKGDWKREATYLQWQGKLSSSQEKCAKEVLHAYQQGKDHLIWAVTGAGKTEMIFPLVDYALRSGDRVAIASPRVDVCNELFPRFQSAFPQVTIKLMHGRLKEAYFRSPLTILTTHQLFRFREAFDLLVVDEVDAFPYLGNKSLEVASFRAVKKSGVRVELTATPTRGQEEAIQKNQLSYSMLPARYHRHSLPLPRMVWVGDWREKLRKGIVPKAFLKCLKECLEDGHDFLIFMPNVALMQRLEELLHQKFSNVTFTSVSSRDPERLLKVENMRRQIYGFLLTTTILERGVTFPGIDVMVLGSEDEVFTRSALVQIAGRVGRKSDCPTGKVWFLHEGKTKASQSAIRQIQSLNVLAREEGLIDD